jgi:hypothetical protein
MTRRTHGIHRLVRGRHCHGDIGDDRCEHLGQAEQQHPELLFQPGDAARLFETRAVHRAHVNRYTAAPQPVVVTVRVDHVVAGVVEPTQREREAERAQAAVEPQLTVSVQGAVDRRARRQHVDVVTAADEFVRELVSLVPDADLAAAGQVIRDHRDPQRSGRRGHGRLR